MLAARQVARGWVALGVRAVREDATADHTGGAVRPGIATDLVGRGRRCEDIVPPCDRALVSFASPVLGRGLAAYHARRVLAQNRIGAVIYWAVEQDRERPADRG